MTREGVLNFNLISMPPPEGLYAWDPHFCQTLRFLQKSELVHQ